MMVEVVRLNRAGVFGRAGCKEDRVMTPAEALQKLREDKAAAWVLPGDADAVLAAYRAEVAHADNLPAWVMNE